MAVTETTNLGGRSMFAVFWGAGGALLRLALQFGAQIVMARTLGPEQYGIFAIGVIVISFSSFFADVGLAYGLIQKKSVSSNDVRFVFTWQIILGTSVAVAVFVAADEIAKFFGDPRAAAVVRSLSAVCLINALAAPSLNLLKRDLNFKRIQLAQIFGFVVGYGLVGVPLALYGSQVWALVFAWLVQALLVLIVAYHGTRHDLRLLLFHDDSRGLGGYGLTVLATNVVNWIVGNIDRVVVGRMFAVREIGLYSTVSNVLQMPAAALLGVVQPVFFSASSRISDNRDAISEGYRSLVSVVSTYVLPVFVGVAVVSETFVVGLYGAQWRDAATLIPPLALAVPLFLVWGFTTPLLWTAGYPSREVKTQLPIAVGWAAATWLAAHHSLAATAWTVFGLYFLRCLFIVRSAARCVSLSKADLWRVVRGGIVCALTVGLVVKGFDIWASGLSPVFRLVGDALVGAASLLLVLKLAPVLISRELASLNGRIVATLPRGVGGWLGFLYVNGRDDAK